MESLIAFENGWSCDQVDFQGGALIPIDKPLKWTSFDVVNKLRFCLKHNLQVNKIKVGHSGTLDPLATGLLLVCTGKWTKKLQFLEVQEKEYLGQFILGKRSNTYDGEGEIVDGCDPAHLQIDYIKHVMQQFTGDILQLPPMFSAIKVGGTPLYKLARKGKEMEVEPRKVHISRFVLDNYVLPTGSFRCVVSKGTYIRSLVNDLGAHLGVGAYLSSLRRTRIGPYRVEKAWQLQDITRQLDEYFN